MVVSGREIVFVQSTTEIGGAETVLLNLLGTDETLRDRSCVVTLGFGNGDLPARLRAIGARVHELHAPRMRDVVGTARTVWEIARFARANGARCIVGNGTHPHVYAGPAARLARARAIHFVHQLFALPVRANTPDELLALFSPCDRFVANSHATRAALRALRPGVPVSLVEPGTRVHRDESNEARAVEIRTAFGWGSDTVVYGTFGRFQFGKGQDVFVEAAARVCDTDPHARFLVVGGSAFGFEPEFAVALEARVKALGLGERVRFAGFQRDVAPWMLACDVVCHTARFRESFGMVLVEAMALGRPVIATRTGGPETIVEEGVVGRLVAPGEVDPLVTAMRGLARDPAGREVMGRAAEARVAERFTTEAMARAFVAAVDGTR